MSLIKYLVVRSVVFGISLFYGGLTVLTVLFRWFKNGNEFFVVKERSLPPICLQDAAYGRHAYLKLKNIKLHYVENGDRNKPLMLFVHGYPEFWFSWRHQMKEFAATHWVVALDMRGYGDSEKPAKKSEYDLEILQKDIVELVKALKRDSCILVAHDWGGVIAWNVAANYPEVVEKLVIMNSPHPTTFREKLRGSIGQFLKSWYIFLYQLPYIPEWSVHTNDLEIFDRIFVDENNQLTITEEELEGYKYTFSRKGAWTPPINYYRQNFNIKGMIEGEKSLPKIRAPTLIIWGENDIALSKDFPELARPHVQNLTVKYVPKGNHFVQQDKVAEVNAHLAEFLNKA
ncbi:unnamed protein product [Allacma fusca]|uniref:AB hydrolase-1 domain-containing protein n=1 Tax=Allacma fusca TaxID=39272 RepID=A0A8J2NXA3_9HEXA|nr:unnamed protein product [Allacma fusca]